MQPLDPATASAAPDRDVAAFDECAAGYESGRLGRWHLEIADRTAARALAPGGTLVLTDLFSALLWPTLRGDRRGKARTRGRAAALLTAAGLMDVTWHPCYALILGTVTAAKP
ncbi:MAG TPA: hypothetical protein VF204_20300 [Streptosporangiaceae bacterium]